jgi:hypothetical protein
MPPLYELVPEGKLCAALAAVLELFGLNAPKVMFNLDNLQGNAHRYILKKMYL